MCAWHLRCAAVLYDIPRSSVIFDSVFSEFRAEATRLVTSMHISLHVDCVVCFSLFFSISL